MKPEVFKQLVKEIVQQNILCEDADVDQSFAFMWNGAEYEIEATFEVGTQTDQDYRPSPGGGFESPEYESPDGISIEDVKSIKKNGQVLQADEETIEKIATAFVRKHGAIGANPQEVAQNKRSFSYLETNIHREFDHGHVRGL